MRSLTELIQKVAGGDVAARDKLFAVAYSELRKLARSRDSGLSVARAKRGTAGFEVNDRAYLRCDNQAWPMKGPLPVA